MLKAAIAACVIAATAWRLASPARLPWFVSYALACAAMAAGPGLIWNMSHVGAGALLLHGGLLGCVLMLWRDPATAARLAALIAARRGAHREGSPALADARQLDQLGARHAAADQEPAERDRQAEPARPGAPRIDEQDPASLLHA